VQTALWLVVVIAAGFLLRLTAGFSVPLVFAIFLAVLFTPVADWFEGFRLPRAVATGLSMVAVLGCLVLFGSIVALSASSIASKSSDYAQRGTELVASLSDWTEEVFEFDLSASLQRQELTLPPLVDRAVRPLTDVVEVVIGLLFTLIFYGFLLHFRAEMRSRLFEIFVYGSRRPGDRELAIVGAGTTVRRYLWIKFLMSIATGTAIGLAALALSLDFPLVWGLLAFGLNFIPSLGPMLAVLPAAAVGVVQSGFAYGFVVAAVMAGLHFLSGNVIEPVIFGYRLRLNFLVILLSLFVWGLVWGFAGMVLAVPITACLKLVLDYSPRPTVLGLLLGGASETPRRPPRPPRAT